MANPQGNPHPPPIMKHSYSKFKGRGDDDDADSYIKLFESVSITIKEDNDGDRMRIFPSLLRKLARSRVLTKLQNLSRGKKKNLWDYIERFQDLLDRISKTGAGVPYSTQQAIDWYVTRLPLEMKTLCRRNKDDDIEEVIALAEAFETFMLN
ncbi:hypothetical protein AXG93_3103s1000 [Marchantia polymorpha subsp. ruderalis]|uniref:Retrotransposon gag domain-containing protein n=1 Tax=Marchantia polymorpha subsp. ruderalis TaxID=1480154 RepID=A0A176WI49_MARPO|nr:hypothetical protein AXG93_3103s1000 [Marchantia polymorpha subsp. ruderalis]